MKCSVAVEVYEPVAYQQEFNPDPQAAFVAESELFLGLTTQECRVLASSANHQTFSRDNIVFWQGQQICDVILVESGTIRLSQSGGNRDDHTLSIHARGDVLALPLEGPRSRHTCSAQAIEACSVLRWDRSFFLRTMRIYPEIRSNVDSYLLRRLRNLEERYREAIMESTANRLARAIFRLTHSMGQKQSEGVLISITRKELAKLTGLSMFTASRYVAFWGDRGIIVPGRNAIVVRNPGEFLAACENAGELA